MSKNIRLTGKKILIVDDEPDVLETLEESLSMCDVSKASTFEEGKTLMETQEFDIAVLDIMGVQGFDLLDIAVNRKITAVMLTAHALTPDSIVKSYKKGAAYFLPKEEMAGMAAFLEDILAAKRQGRSTWLNWLDMLTDTYWEKKFGPDWQRSHKKFWDEFKEDNK